MKKHVRLYICVALAMCLPVFAGSPEPLTFQKINHVAQNCGSNSGFTAWLKTKQGVDVKGSSSFQLTSLPSKSRVYFTLNGQEHAVLVSPVLYYPDIEKVYLKRIGYARNKGHLDDKAERDERIRREVRVLDQILADYESGQSKK